LGEDSVLGNKTEKSSRLSRAGGGKIRVNLKVKSAGLPKGPEKIRKGNPPSRTCGVYQIHQSKKRGNESAG